VTKAKQGGQPGQQSPDLQSATGWIYTYQQLSQGVPVRDFLWLP
jgi:hypothetical protein